jgi:hypothetical protein
MKEPTAGQVRDLVSVCNVEWYKTPSDKDTRYEAIKAVIAAWEKMRGSQPISENVLKAAFCAALHAVGAGSESFDSRDLKFSQAFADVCNEARDAQWTKAIQEESDPFPSWRFQSASLFIEAVRARVFRFAQPPEKRVTIARASDVGPSCKVFLDGEERGLFGSEEDGLMFRDSLIAKLKESEST